MTIKPSCSLSLLAALLLLASSQTACHWIWPRDNEAEKWTACRCPDGSALVDCLCPPEGRIDTPRDAGIERGRDQGINDRDQAVSDLPLACPGQAAAKSSADAGINDPWGRWVTIPRGTFKMGSPVSEPCRLQANTAEALGAETEHTVTLTHDFEIQATEVTQEQFEQWMGYNPSAFPSCGSSCPVEWVSWHEAAAYCNALSQQKWYTPCYQCSGSGSGVVCGDAGDYSGAAIYDCPGYRLPTEAEWEYAYRACSGTAYYNGASVTGTCDTSATANEIGWYEATAGGTTHPVGQRQPNAWGLYDMAGNVWEWCHDVWQPDLGSSEMHDPVVTTGEDTAWRVCKGGSWRGLADLVRAATRAFNNAIAQQPHMGFRCVRTTH